jgi:hypothetical protein
MRNREVKNDIGALKFLIGLDLVLSGISLTILPREKIGIVGRTGTIYYS